MEGGEFGSATNRRCGSRDEAVEQSRVQNFGFLQLPPLWASKLKAGTNYGLSSQAFREVFFLRPRRTIWFKELRRRHFGYTFPTSARESPDVKPTSPSPPWPPHSNVIIAHLSLQISSEKAAGVGLDQPGP